MSEERTTTRETAAWMVASAAVTLAVGITLGSLFGVVHAPDATGSATPAANSEGVVAAPAEAPPATRVVLVPVQPAEAAPSAVPATAAPDGDDDAHEHEHEHEHDDDDGWLALGEARHREHGHRHHHAEHGDPR